MPGVSVAASVTCWMMPATAPWCLATVARKMVQSRNAGRKARRDAFSAILSNSFSSASKRRPETNSLTGLKRLTTAATPTKKVTTTTKTYTGPSVEADRWGPIQVTITVKTTTTTVGSKTTVARKIVKISTPVYPDHTDRSLYISQQAIPVLFQEVLAAQSASIDMVTRATDTSQAFIQSLQGALTKAKLASAAATSPAPASQAA